jgi:hypothetical protein
VPTVRTDILYHSIISLRKGACRRTMVNSSSTAARPSSNGSQNHSQQSQLGQTWNEFIRALNSPQAFHPLTWIYRLSKDATAHVYRKTGCAAFVLRYQLHKAWQPMIPIFGLTLIVLIVVAYFASIRFLIQERWCCGKTATSTTAPATSTCDSCSWLLFHDFWIVYFSGMMFFYYRQTTFQSPGVALASTVSQSTTTTTNRSWKAMDCQGGLLGWDPVYDEAAERKRVELYGTLPDAKTLTETGVASASAAFVADLVCQPVVADSNSNHRAGGVVTSKPVPSPDPTYCDRCKIVRPARCHHCSTCNRCVLQYDHHCLWLNNCVGYNNYRSFLLTIFFLMAGCWYGVGLLFWPFYEPLRAQVNEHGWHFLYSNGTGFLDLPTPMKLVQMMVSADGIPVKIVIDLVYPFLFGVGAVLFVFLCMHIKYILNARTSLEHRIVLNKTYGMLVQPGASPRDANKPPPNPFDQGWYRNMLQILGPNPLWILLPVAVPCPPPYVPKGSKDDTKNR